MVSFMKQILIVDDEEKIRTLIRKYAEFEGYSVSEARNGRDAVALCRKIAFDLVLLDVMMPEMDGLEACREIRNFSSVPILMLTALGEEYDRISGFRCGVDDYVVKPFSPKELMLRIAAILKRSAAQEHADANEMLRYFDGGLTVDVNARRVYLDGVFTEFAAKEFDLLLFLLRNRNLALTREQILEGAWGFSFLGDSRTVDTHVKQIRRLLGKYAEHLVTLYAYGYRFEV